EAEHGAPYLEPLHGAVLADEEGGVVARVHVLEMAAPGIEPGQHERDVLVLGDVLADRAVDAPHRVREGQAPVRARRGPEVGLEAGRAHSLPGEVARGQERPAVLLTVVVVVAAPGAAGLVEPHDPVAGHLGAARGRRLLWMSAAILMS